MRRLLGLLIGVGVLIYLAMLAVGRAEAGILAWLIVGGLTVIGFQLWKPKTPAPSEGDRENGA
jgi:hypothetical protein